MPAWNERKAITTRNLLVTFSESELRQLTTGELCLVTKKTGPDARRYFYPCDTERRAHPRHWARPPETRYHISQELHGQVDLRRFALTPESTIRLFWQATTSIKAFDWLCQLMEHGIFIRPETGRTVFIGNPFRKKITKKLNTEPQTLIRLAAFIQGQTRYKVYKYIDLLFLLIESLGNLTPLTATHATNSVLNIFLSSTVICEALTEKQFLHILQAAYCVKKTPLSPPYIDRAIKMDGRGIKYNPLLIYAARCGDYMMINALKKLNRESGSELVDLDTIDPKTGKKVLGHLEPIYRSPHVLFHDTPSGPRIHTLISDDGKAKLECSPS